MKTILTIVKRVLMRRFHTVKESNHMHELLKSPEFDVMFPCDANECIKCSCADACLHYEKDDEYDDSYMLKMNNII